ncbi:MAG: MFS transporter [Roseibacillus sp.]
MRKLLRHEGPFRHRNVRLYAWFSVLYNARAYYPVFAIFFFALGLDVTQFFLMNMVWAAAIFLFEVPSGALADTIGRKRLVVFASALMVAEMALLLCAPQNGGWVLLTMCILNRLLSGTSEASASGADQSLAYDTLFEHGDEELWDDVLATTMRWRSIGFFVAMIIGALVYDPKFLNWLLGTDFDQATTLRLPVAIVFVQSLFCLAVSLRMREPVREGVEPCPLGERCASAIKLTLRTAAWVLKTPLAFRIVLGTLLIDAVVRNFVTINSEYYRLIELPEFTFGFIGALTAGLGFFVPTIAKGMLNRYSPITNLALIAAMVLGCLVVLIPAVPYFVLPIVILFTAFGFLEFLSSSTLHKLADSSQRATVLSVKGLGCNLGYGSLALGYAGVLGWFETEEGSPGGALLRALPWQALYFAITMALFLAVFWRPQRPKRPR